MSLSTYQALIDGTADWLARNDIDPARSADFVTLFEAYAGRLLRDSQMEQAETLFAEAGAAELALPGDFREGRSLRHLPDDDDGDAAAAGEALAFDPPAALGEAWPRRPAGRPQRYTIIGRRLRLWPVPDRACSLELVYFGGLCALSATRTSNWLLRAAPDAYLNGALAEAADYLDDDRKAQKFAAKRDAALQAIITGGMRARWGAGPLAVRAEYKGI